MLSDTQRAVDSFAQFFTVLLIFAVVLIITYLTTRYIAGIQKGRFKGTNIEVIEAQRISQNICVDIVRIGERYFALTVGRDSVTLLSELSGDEIKEAPEGQIMPVGFRQIFDQARGRFGRNAVSGEAAGSVTDKSNGPDQEK